MDFDVLVTLSKPLRINIRKEWHHSTKRRHQAGLKKSSCLETSWIGLWKRRWESWPHSLGRDRGTVTSVPDACKCRVRSSSMSGDIHDG